MIKLDTLLRIVNNKYVTEDLCIALNYTMFRYMIDTPLRICHFLAQIIHESGSFKCTEEIASGESYEFRKDLGNFEKGDGVKYKGRGLIQITGKINYTELSKALGTDFVKTPEKLEQYPWAAVSAGWYWNSRELNYFADKDDILTITRKINGGTNGLTDRKFWFDKCKKIIMI